MTFEVIIHPKAAKALEKMQRDIANRIMKKLEEAKHEPKKYTEKLVESEDYKIRVGDYRIFVGIIYDTTTLEVYSIKHRREAYKKK